MLARRAFLSFTQVTDPAAHAEYNAWRQLDNSYWFRDPVDECFAQWQDLAVRTFHQGRRPDVRVSRRVAMGTVMPVKGYVNPRCLIGADALPICPNRGIALVATRLCHPGSAESEQYFARQDREVIPALMECEGVAGGWAFVNENTTLDAGRDADDGVTFAEDVGTSPGEVPIVMVFLDGDLVRYRADRTRRDVDLEPKPSDHEFELLFSGLLRTIEPWELVMVRLVRRGCRAFTRPGGAAVSPDGVCSFGPTDNAALPDLAHVNGLDLLLASGTPQRQIVRPYTRGEQ